MKILLTGFDPFGGETTNPSMEAIKLLDDQIAGAQIIKIELPTAFHKSAEIVEDNIKKHRPDVILSVGQAGGRSAISIERVAINIDDARIADNAGNSPIDEPIIADGPAAYFSNLPIKAMYTAIKDIGLPATISNTAGTFVCNHIMYQNLYLAEKYGNIQAGFIHVPYIPSQVVDKANVPSMSLEDIAKGLETAIRAIVEYHNKDDIKIDAGKLD